MAFSTTILGGGLDIQFFSLNYQGIILQTFQYSLV